MLNLHQIYIRKIFALFVILSIFLGVIAYYWLKGIYIEEAKKALLNDMKLVGMIAKRESDLDSLAKKIKRNLNIRVTIVDEEGKVLAESDKDKTKMDNHKHRPEIEGARFGDYGFSIRHSRTLNKDLLYVAKKYEIHNRSLYIRLAKPLTEVQEALFSFVWRIFLVIALFLVFVSWIFYKIGVDVEEEIDKIIKFLRNLTKKRKSLHIESNYSKEFHQITKLLSKVARILSKQDRSKAKYTAKLEASNLEKDNIISAISHEFKNPIAVIDGYVQTLLNDKELDEEIRVKFLQKVDKNAKKLVKLIDTLRLAIKLEDKKQKIDKREVDIYEIAKECAEDLKETFKGRSIVLEGESVVVLGDRVLLEVMLKNLMENALKYSEDDIFVKVTKDYILVEDKGIGISQKDIKHITDKFYRADSNLWSNSLGLGLFIVSNIVKAHGFSLDIDSKPNEGSIFRVKFL